MLYGICHLSVVPVRFLADSASGLLTQLLYGEHFKVLENRKHLSKIRVAHDNSEGWIDNKQFQQIEKDQYEKIEKMKSPKFSSELVSFACGDNNNLIPILLGSSVSHSRLLSHVFEGEYLNGQAKKMNLVRTAMFYLNAPFEQGGRTPFGIDASGLAQMVYRINGHSLPRLAADQAGEGESLSFIEESEAGDLAFFDNKEGVIDHVGIIMEDNYVIHAHGNVRIDRLDHTGIFNADDRQYSHSLRVIKKIM